MSRNISKTIRKWTIEEDKEGRDLIWISDLYTSQSAIVYGLDNDGIPKVAYDNPLSIPLDVDDYIKRIAYLYTGVIAAKCICNTASINIYYLNSYYVVAGINNDIPRWYKVYETVKGRPYFNFRGTREYLDEYSRLS